MKKSKLSRKERERKRRDEEKSHRELELSQEDVEKILEKQKETNELQELQRIQFEKLKDRQQLVTKETFDRLTLDIQWSLQERWESQAWSRYMSCDGRPNIEDPRQVNTFISRWLDESGTTDSDEPLTILEQCDEAVQLIEELSDLLLEALHLPKKILEACDQIRVDLQNAIKCKLDQSTLALLKRTSFSTDSETGNSYFFGRNDNVEMAVWSNLSCNSRYSGTEASELGINFSIPRSLVVTECAVRFLKLSADNQLTSFIQFPSIPFVWNCIFECGDGDDGTKEQSKTSFQINLMDGVDVESGLVDTDEYFVVGSLFSVDLLNIPPQRRTIKNWVMTRVEDPDTLKHIDWLCDYTGDEIVADNDDANDAKKDDEESEREQQERVEEELKKLVFISIKLSDDVLWNDVPKLAYRHYYYGHDIGWTTSGLHQISHKEDSNIVSFYTTRFGTFAFLQSRFATFPYQSWELYPNTSDLTAGHCIIRQIQSNEKSLLNSIYGHSIKPARLFKRLQAAGIYITPNPNDILYTTNIKQKNKQLEMSIYRQIAVASSLSGFSSSRWNANVGRDKFVIRFRYPDQPADKAKQPVILVTPKEATLLAITELSQNFSERPSEENQVAVDLYHVVEYLRSESKVQTEGINSNVDSIFVDTVFQVLATCGILHC